MVPGLFPDTLRKNKISSIIHSSIEDNPTLEEVRQFQLMDGGGWFNFQLDSVWFFFLEIYVTLRMLPISQKEVGSVVMKVCIQASTVNSDKKRTQ